MSWVDHCTWTDGLRAVFGADLPDPTGWGLVGLTVERNAVTAVVDLRRLPASPPAKWLAAGARTTHVTLGLDPQETLQVEGPLDPGATLDLSLEPDPAGGLRFVLTGPGLTVSTRTQFVTVQSFTGERGTPEGTA